MDFIDRITDLAARIPRQIDHLHTEEATKHALVMPFINALGYNVFDPTEVLPEFTADVGIKRGEKVDYAIIKDGKPIMLIECKTSTTDLDRVTPSQLYRYFSVTEARFGILTNGVIYRFFADLDQPNRMDTKPFFEFDMLDVREPIVEELKKFTKTTFDVDDILNTASELKYTREIMRILGEQLTNPSEDFVRLFAKQVYSGIMTKQVREQFALITKRAFHQFINERISLRLQSALAHESSGDTNGRVDSSASLEASTTEQRTDEKEIETSVEEMEGFYIVKAILREIVDPKRIAMRDAKSYCAVLFDDNNRKPICRLRFNRSVKYLGVFDEQRQEQRIHIGSVDDIYLYADRLRATINSYEPQMNLS